ncbi:SusC/RagA family TonB-linked outer membrane protein [Puteibacter caeruleilacunae]|nr:SusC/RagA family TonB-linked outer membrane protein [Puteibacter caeruleilacunae]
MVSFGNSFSQTRLSFKCEQATIDELLETIEQQTNYVFLYKDGVFNHQKRYSLNFRKSQLDEVLRVICKNANVDYEIRNDRQILFVEKAKAPEAKPQPVPAEQKMKKISGNVTDSNGALPGVTVVVKGSSRGVITDIDGKYSIDVEDSDVLVFSFIGMTTQEIAVKGRSTVDVVLKDKSEDVEEVVVVAFGKQKRTDMIGSVTTMNTKELQKISTSNLTTALAGQVAGVISYQRTGEPGEDNADFFVRGVTTFGEQANRSPLILIDGVELTSTDLARLQKDDIASFSILKDATATALYGARGANGVILVSTKQGREGKAKISARFENSISAPTKNIKLADPITYMEMHNEAVITRDPLGQTIYSQRKIDNTKAGLNPYVYPKNDWYKLLFKDRTMNQRMNLNVSGGGKVARYYVAGSYNHDSGILKSHKLNNFNSNISLNSFTLRTNVNINIAPTTELIVKLNGVFDDYTGPLEGGGSMYKKVIKSNPVLFPAYFPVDEEHKYVNHIMFGNYGEGKYLNPFADMVKGYKDYSRSRMLAQFEVKQDLDFITEGLRNSTMVNTNRYSFFDVKRNYNPFFYEASNYDPVTDTYTLTQLNPDEGTENLGDPKGGDKKVSSNFYLENRLIYNRTFAEKHGVSGLFVFRMRESLDGDFESVQTSLPHRNMGLSGRTTYTYDKRYFAEFNFGYNGSERFHESQRFGFFPSAGVAWTISNEGFFENMKRTVNNLRLRGSYGVVGNDAIGSSKDRFFYLSEVNMNDGKRKASFGRDNGYSKNGVRVSRYANPDITWEKAYKTNIALEVGLWEKLTIQAELFNEKRTNILMTREAVPNTMGLQSDIKANVGEASGKGVDLNVDYKQSWDNGMWFSARGNFTYATNEYKVFEEPDYDEYWRSRIGQSIQQQYGYIAERLFIDDEEAANSPVQNFGGNYTVGGGDIKYTDINGDGEITEADKVPIGNPTLPEIVYGFGFSLGYKNFDFSAFFQGLANESFWIDAEKTSPFVGENQVLKAYADSYWSESNRDVYALWPRLSVDKNTNNLQRSTWFMRDGSFLRLKQIELGYNLPKSFRNHLGLSTCRFYLNASNLLTFSKFKLWDVEMGGNGLGYPVQRTINFGINVSFK